MKRLVFAAALAVSPAAAAEPSPAPAPRPALDALVAELRAKPDDQALRERIIQASLAMDPRPKVPEAARRHFVQAVTLQTDAKDVQDYELAAAEYREALLKAPWWPEAYYNQSVAQAGAGRLADAIASLTLYLQTAPKEDEAREAQDRIYSLEAKQKKAAKDAVSSHADAAAKQEQERRDFLAKLDGGRWQQRDDGKPCWDIFLEIYGRSLYLIYSPVPPSAGRCQNNAGSDSSRQEVGSAVVNGPEFSAADNPSSPPRKYEILDGGRRIRMTFAAYDVIETYDRVR